MDNIEKCAELFQILCENKRIERPLAACIYYQKTSCKIHI